jgi:hypothetical protein
MKLIQDGGKREREREKNLCIYRSVPIQHLDQELLLMKGKKLPCLLQDHRLVAKVERGRTHGYFLLIPIYTDIRILINDYILLIYYTKQLRRSKNKF